MKLGAPLKSLLKSTPLADDLSQTTCLSITPGLLLQLSHGHVNWLCATLEATTRDALEGLIPPYPQHS